MHGGSRHVHGTFEGLPLKALLIITDFGEALNSNVNVNLNMNLYLNVNSNLPTNEHSSSRSRSGSRAGGLPEKRYDQKRHNQARLRARVLFFSNENP